MLAMTSSETLCCWQDSPYCSMISCAQSKSKKIINVKVYAVVLAYQVSYIGDNFGTLVVVKSNVIQYYGDCIIYQINA